MKKLKEKCRYCGKGEKLKYYIIADDLEHPKPYHPKCMKLFTEDVMIKIYKQKLEEKKVVNK